MGERLDSAYEIAVEVVKYHIAEDIKQRKEAGETIRIMQYADTVADMSWRIACKIHQLEADYLKLREACQDVGDMSEDYD